MSRTVSSPHSLCRVFVKAPGSQEARRGLVSVAVAAVWIPQLVAPTALVAAPAAQQGHEGPAVAPTMSGIGAPGPFLHCCPPATPQACDLLVLGQHFVSAVVGPWMVPVCPFPQPAPVPPSTWAASGSVSPTNWAAKGAVLQLLVHRAEHLWRVCFGLCPAAFSVLTGLTSWSTWASARTGSHSCRC